MTVGNNLTVTGNLTVNGTTTTVNSTTTTVDDPVFTLGGDSVVSDDNKDRGIEFRYHNGSRWQKLVSSVSMTQPVSLHL